MPKSRIRNKAGKPANNQRQARTNVKEPRKAPGRKGIAMVVVGGLAITGLIALITLHRTSPAAVTNSTAAQSAANPPNVGSQRFGVL